jgi:CRISPR-associated protein Csb2
MALVLEIEHLLGVAYAAQSPASPIPDWPLQPDRVFSALVAAWGARGEKEEERRALEWLEALAAPEIAASGGFARTPATVFVPPNDPETGRVGNRTVMPSFRRRQQRRFPAFRPHDPVIRLVWHHIDVDDETIATLNVLAADTAYIGHSASLTRCRFRIDNVTVSTAPPDRGIYAGRLAELESLYRARRRPGAGEVVRSEPPADTQIPRSVFAERWLVLEHIAGEMPDLRAAAVMAKALRATLMSGYKRNGQGTAIPATVSGHADDGSPLSDPHLAIVPLAFLGPRVADGHMLGLALVPPDNGELLSENDFRNAVRQVSKWNAAKGWRELHLKGVGIDLTFKLSGEGSRKSLEPTPYVAEARTWATCTPIAIDRHLKAKGNTDRETEIESLVRKACLNIGLPEPKRVVAGKHSAVNGAPSAYPSGHAPNWTRWRLPKSLESRQLTHAVVQFAGPVRGPVILGAGRFVGLGFCRAIDPVRR